MMINSTSITIILSSLNWLQRDKAKREEKCYGTDPNRNFDVNWSRRGSSSSPCSDFYAGPKPFSEPETKNLAKFLDENKKLINVCDFYFYFNISMNEIY